MGADEIHRRPNKNQQKCRTCWSPSSKPSPQPYRGALRRPPAHRNTPPDAAVQTKGGGRSPGLRVVTCSRPSQLPSGHHWRSFAAYSCGGSRGLRRFARTAFPFDPRREPPHSVATIAKPEASIRFRVPLSFPTRPGPLVLSYEGAWSRRRCVRLYTEMVVELCRRLADPFGVGSLCQSHCEYAQRFPQVWL